MRLLMAALTLSLGATAFAETANPPAEVPSLEQMAQRQFQIARDQGEDLNTGPCLGEIAPGWVADIAHAPRLALDDDPKNQCSEFLSGRDTHVVELDVNGKVIRSQ